MVSLRQVIYNQNQMSEQKLKICLPNPRQKLQPLFPSDNRGDINIIFGNKTFKLQKAFLRLQSGYFKKTFSATETLLLKQDFNQNYFSNILKCFYGFTIQINRAQIFEYFAIVKFLQVDSLLKLLRDDMINKTQSYDIFVLFQIAHKYNQQSLFEACVSQVDKEGYQQLRYAKHELLKCPIELFKMIIKTHNRKKSQEGKGIAFLQIDQLIKEFSQEKKLNETQYQQLKFQLIDKRSLTSQQYKQIFLDDVKRKKNSIEYRSMMKLPGDTSASYSSGGFNNNLLSVGKLTQSVIEPLKKGNQELTMQIQNTYEKKKNQQLQAENIYLSTQLNGLKVKSTEHSTSIESLREFVSKLQTKLQEKDRIDKQQSTIIKKLEKACLDLKGEVTNRNELIKKLEDRLLKLEKQPQKRIPGNPKYIPYDEEDKTVQSQIVPGNLLREMAKPAADALNPPTNSTNFKKTKPPTPIIVNEPKVEQELDEDQIEQMYSSRLQFDKEPIGCNKRFLPKLANFLTTDGFQKKKLQLLFRRNISNQQTIGQVNDIRNRNSLLVLICTKFNQVIGGFTSISINKNSNSYISDENAFIFSLTKNQKFNIKKSNISQAIFMSSDYIIGFSNDIMISADCIKTQCECSWPDAYENSGEKRSSKWLTGQQSAFSIKHIEIYEVKEEEMIMDL